MTGINETLRCAVDAALSRKAESPIVLDLSGLSSFTDSFLLCHGTSVRQVQAITDAVDQAMRETHGRKARIEGYEQGEWVLMDYGELVVHVFTEEKRDFFDLERLWGDAPRWEVEDDGSGAPELRRTGA